MGCSRFNEGIVVSGKECNLFLYFTNYTDCDSFKLWVVVSEKDFSVETTIVGLLDTMVLLIGWSVI